jgi:hypothetical protein
LFTNKLYRDKIRAGGKSRAGRSRVGLSFQKESVELRRRPANIRGLETGKLTTAGKNDEPEKLHSQKTTTERETDYRDVILRPCSNSPVFSF